MGEKVELPLFIKHEMSDSSARKVLPVRTTYQGVECKLDRSGGFYGELNQSKNRYPWPN